MPTELSTPCRPGSVGGAHFFLNVPECMYCTKFNGVKGKTSHGKERETGNMTEILGSPNLAKRAENYMASYRILVASFGRAMFCSY